MQDIHSIGGGGAGGGRLFGGGGGGDRRLRPHHHHQGRAPQALKCPRCESLNTKFCYYNNYNLSQPRHFCKNCRRYWTKGGVLRNVPVGGGCRKTKRSKSKSNNNNNRSSDTAVRKSSNSQNSSSDSSSLTANTTAANTTVTTTTANAPVTAAEVLSSINSTNSAPTMLNFHESSTGFLNIPQSSTPNPSFDPPLLDHSSAENNNIFPEIGTFTSLITPSTAQLPLGFNMAADTSPFRLHHPGHIVESLNANQHQWMHTDHTMGNDLKVHESSSLGFMEMQNKTTDGGLGTEDWNNGADQTLFDLTGTVDQSYWNETQWDDDHDHGHGHGHHQLNYLP